MVKASTAAALAGGLVLLGTSYFVLSASARKPPPGTFMVSIDVVDSSTGLAVQYAGVTLDLLANVTDGSGSATFSGVSGGPHAVAVTKSGYLNFTESVYVTTGSTSFTVKLKECVVQACSCSQVWDPTLCQCDSLKPSYMDALPGLQFNQDWYAHVNVGPLGNSIQCAGATPGGDPGCNGTCGGPTAVAWVTVTVTASDGSPICDVPVAGLLSASNVPWRTSDGWTWGHFNFTLGVGGPLYTDDKGQASFPVVFQVVVDGTKGASGEICLGCCGPSTAPAQVYSVIFQAQVQGTQIRTLTNVEMESSVFVYYYD